VGQSNFPDWDHNSIATHEIKIQTELPRDIKNCHNHLRLPPSNLVFILLTVFYFDTFEFFTYTSFFVRGIFALS